MDAGLFIYFPWDPGHNIILRCLTAKLTASPLPPDSTVRPLTKKGPFPNSTDCHTNHIAMLHGRCPSITNITALPRHNVNGILYS